MKNSIRKTTALMMSMALVAGTMSAIVASAEDVNFTSGECTAVLSDEGALTISGSGAMDDVLGWLGSYTEDVKTASIENGVTNLSEYCLWNCENLTDVTVASSVTAIGDYAFANCAGLKTITFSNTAPATLGASVFDDAAADFQIIVPADSVDTYKSAWSDVADLIVAAEAPAEDNVLKSGQKYVQTADNGGKHYVRYVFVKPLSELENASKAVFTATYKGVTKEFETTSYYTGITTNGKTYTLESEELALFVVTITGVDANDEANVACTLDLVAEAAVAAPAAE